MNMDDNVQVVVVAANPENHKRILSAVKLGLGQKPTLKVRPHYHPESLVDFIRPIEGATPFPNLKAVVVANDTDSPEYGLPHLLYDLNKREIDLKPSFIFVGFSPSRLTAYLQMHGRAAVSVSERTLEEHLPDIINRRVNRQ